MKSDSINRLIEALGRPAQQSTIQSKTQAGSTPAKDSSAVKLASSFSGGTSASDAEDRAKRVSEIKNQVDSGTYKPKSEDVAQSLIRDLGI